MAASELFTRYIWLVDTIYRAGAISRQEINRRWADSVYNVNSESEIPHRTFHRHKEAVKQLFGIEIVCDHGGDRLYRIANAEEMAQDGLRSWLLNSFSINSLLQESRNLRGRILFEEVPSGDRFLTTFIEAMRDNKRVLITHRSFSRQAAVTTELEPLCLKLSRQRWYLLANRLPERDMRVYGLDRISNVETTQSTFALPRDFDAEAIFSQSVGVMLNPNPELVSLRVKGLDRDYLRTLPVHHSQKEVERTDEASVFTYYVRPTYDFIQKLLSFGANVEVLKPQWLRQRIKSIIAETGRLYAD